ncbi:MAG: MalY/PatB family protein [Microthrixaceae bacterium]
MGERGGVGRRSGTHGPDPFQDVDLTRLRRRRTVKWSLHGPDVLAAWVAEMDFDVAEPIRAALLDAVEREDFGYVEADLSALTTACADLQLALHGWQVSPARVFPVADVLGGITAALDVFTPPGAPVVVPTPAYPPFFEVIELGGRSVAPVPMHLDGERWRLDPERIDAALAGGARAVMLCNPHNPTGRAFDADELGALAAVVEHHGARVVADEVHAPLVLPGARHVPYASLSDATAAHTVTLTSASKAWNVAGLKCAQVVLSNHEDAARWRRLPVFAVAGPTPLGVAASVAAYRDGDAWRRGLVDHLDRQRSLLGDLLERQLPDVTWSPPEATFLTWLDCSALGAEDPAAHFLHRGRVALSDGPPFGGGHGPGAGYQQFVRLNIGTSSVLLERIVAAMSASLGAR